MAEQLAFGTKIGIDEMPTVLVVDDDRDLRLAMCAMLAKRFQVLQASNGQEALAVLSEHIPELIISDITMPGMDGTVLLQEIRGRDLDIPVILVTGKPQLEGAIRAVEYGAFRYLQKPVNPRELEQVIDEAIHMRKMASAKRSLFQMTNGTPGTASDRAGQIARFERAVESIYLHFQPIYSLDRGTAVGYECLLRCTEATLSEPPALIRAGDELGRTDEIGRAIRQAALEELPRVPEHARLFVNLHYADLNDAELFDPNSEFSRHAERFVLEITERESLDAIAQAQDKVQQLRALGFEIAMDDLGAGHNGLAAFAQLEPEVVKLDMKLVRNLDRAEKQRDLVQVMFDFCEQGGMQVIAEGVETPEELQALSGIGVDLVQGYLIAKPQRHAQEPPNPWDSSKE